MPVWSEGWGDVCGIWLNEGLSVRSLVLDSPPRLLLAVVRLWGCARYSMKRFLTCFASLADLIVCFLYYA